MRFNGVRDYIKDVLWRPNAAVWTLTASFVSVCAWLGVGELWTTTTKVLAVILVFLITSLLYVVQSTFSKYKQVAIYQPLAVRKVLLGEHYLEGKLLVILEQRDGILIGDILTLFLREEDAEVPICLLSVEAITSKSFPQSVVYFSLTEKPLQCLLSDKDRIQQLRAKLGVTRGYLECLMQP